MFPKFVLDLVQFNVLTIWMMK